MKYIVDLSPLLQAESGEEAFSDDDVPEDLKTDPFFQHSDDEDDPKLKKKTKGKILIYNPPLSFNDNLTKKPNYCIKVR